MSYVIYVAYKRQDVKVGMRMSRGEANAAVRRLNAESLQRYGGSNDAPLYFTERWHKGAENAERDAEEVEGPPPSPEPGRGAVPLLRPGPADLQGRGG